MLSGDINDTLNVFVDFTYGGFRVSLSFTVMSWQGSAEVIADCVVDIV